MHACAPVELVHELVAVRDAVLAVRHDHVPVGRLADLVGLDYYTFISQLECGQGRLPPHLYAKYAAALGIDRQTFGREVIKFYDPWTYSTLFGDHPYDMSFETDTEEERSQAAQGCTAK